MPPTAVIAGASSAIGSAIGAELTGHRKLLLGRSRARLEGGDVLEVDLAARDQLLELPARLRERVEAIDVLVLAAGAFDWAPAAEADVARAAGVVDVALTGTIALTHAALPLMGEGGAVVFIGSAASRTAFGHNGAYVAAKHGIAGFAGSVFEDVRGRGIRVSLICPGFVAAGPTLGMGATDAELAGFLAPEDVAEAVAFALAFPGRGCVTEMHLRPLRPSRFEG